MPPLHLIDCPDYLNHGKCIVGHCPYSHELPICDSCGFIFENEDEYQNHLTSDEHVHKSNHDSQTCDPGILANVQPQSAAQTKDTPFCELCEMAVETKLWEGHLGCAKHLCRRAFIRYTAAIKEAEADKDGIAIEGVFDLDCVAPH
jgi:helicase MOV-10